MKFKKHFILLILLKVLFSQAEYQILSIPHNVIQLSSNKVFNNSQTDLYNKEYSFNLIHYPADIMLYNFYTDNYSISFLDYGLFKNQIQDIIYESFSAYEVMANYYYNRQVRNSNINFSFGIFQSNIDSYSSFGLSNSIGISSTYRKNIILTINIENFGYILKSYTAYNQKLPLKYRISLNVPIRKLVLGYDISYLKFDQEFQHTICLQFMPSDKLTIRLSTNNNYKDLWLEDNIYNFISGMGFGLDIKLKKTSISLGFLNLGIAGNIYGTSINFFEN